MMEETRNKWTLLKEKIEWDAVETIPILLSKSLELVYTKLHVV